MYYYYLLYLMLMHETVKQYTCTFIKERVLLVVELAPNPTCN